MADKAGTRRTRPDLDVAKIVGTALALIDEEGLAALSMRSLAERLFVYPTAIYWYVQGRNALLAAVVERVLGDILPSDPGLDAWPDWILALMRAYRAAVMRHPNVAPLLGVDLASNAGVDVSVVDGLLRRLEEAGFRDEALLHAYNIVVAGMIGFVTLELGAAPTAASHWAEAHRARFRGADPGRYPSVARWSGLLGDRAFVVRCQNGATAPMDDTFERFAAVLLDGLRAQLATGVRAHLPPANDVATAGPAPR